ncbi:CLUMA_CG016582, isoform A [Clunio marinus]|uniref:CLUMA_CG016582, isoform A n=1 Tax=Clunio marinus TaxID=568069 RepID=A0A1J1IX51_9DIPT|nr:CLUMA_CG016582, isoform A [Clunio marinus]
MVFESIVADILNRYLGEYVENLDKGQLKIGIWGDKPNECSKLRHICLICEEEKKKKRSGMREKENNQTPFGIHPDL